MTRAILARNFEGLLTEAAERVSELGLDHLVAFRSEKPWKLPHEIVAEQGVAPIYFRTGEGDVVGFEGELVHVYLDGDLLTLGKAAIDAHALPRIKAEQWGNLKTVYVVRGLHAVLPQPIGTFQRPEGEPAAKGMFPYAEVKARDSLPIDAAYPDELIGELAEGAVRRVAVNVYERDPAARAQCIAKHGTSCVVCGFSFERAYGAIGRGFIHVHHLEPLGVAKAEHTVDPVADLRPVCPNCHAMLHRRAGNPYSIDELRAFLAATKGES